MDKSFHLIPTANAALAIRGEGAPLAISGRSW
jgi:hypothetical protein